MQPTKNELEQHKSKRNIETRNSKSRHPSNFEPSDYTLVVIENIGKK